MYLRSHIILHVHWSTLQAATSYIVAIKIKNPPENRIIYEVNNIII